MRMLLFFFALTGCSKNIPLDASMSHSIGVIVTQAVHPKPQGGFSLTNRSQSVEQATQT